MYKDSIPDERQSIKSDRPVMHVQNQIYEEDQ